MLPQLRRLAARFESELAVIGVHSGKYPNERRTPHIRHAAQRFSLDHPILNDRKYRTWRSYGINAWPTLVLIDPAGRVLGAQPGETTAEQWTPILERLIAEYESSGVIDRRQSRVSAAHESMGLLRYPDKVLADGPDRLFIADTGQHRVVVADRNGGHWQTTMIVGSGEEGRDDGSIHHARFNLPRGLALIDGTLYVADTGNHLIRAVDLTTHEVRTVAGTGERTRRPFGSGPGTRVAIASPWDLVTHDGKLVIAMAGTHQLWAFDHADESIGPLAGNGHESIADGPLLDAALGQPCGITSDGVSLFFADSESQAIRRATTDPDGQVITIIGTGLFDFGDKDGVGDDALLQHPQAVAAHGGRLYVADSYNHKIKIVDPATRESRTWLGRRRIPGHDDGPADAATFYEPGGLSIGGDTLFIADTNNHAIRAADLGTGEVRTLVIEGGA